MQGGGWLSALGRNLNMGHGLIDFGGAGTVHLAAAGFVLAALVVWLPRASALLSRACGIAARSLATVDGGRQFTRAGGVAWVDLGESASGECVERSGLDARQC